MKQSLIFVLSIFSFLLSCNGGEGDDSITPTEATITYQEATDDFPNPERGFYRYSETNSTNYAVLNKTTLQSYRTAGKVSSNANHEVLSTLVFRYFVLDGFKTTAISETYLTNVKADFQAARDAGVKLIPRFTYTITPTAGSCPTGFACPPYGDATKAIILSHIAQLKPILQENADVIACVQMGFIGIWGEQYYTDYFGDSSSNASQGKLLDANWQDRLDVLKALLDALPKDRMVQVRYPQIKQRYVYGIQATTLSAAMDESEAYTETDKARIGYHNDCLLASPDDYGTYFDYGNSATGAQSATTRLRNYFSLDSKYVVVGGETCDDAYSPQNDCEPAGRAEQEFRDLHYSYLNAHYNLNVNNDWQTGGCMENIKKKLGYRFVLRNATLPNEVKTGNPLKLTLNLENIGYAAPYNPRPVQLILRSKSSSSQVYAIDLTADARKWFPGTVQVQQSVTLPAQLMAGDYEVFLNLPDKYASIAKRPEYSIRLANTNLWEASTGYNKLNHTLRVVQ